QQVEHPRADLALRNEEAQRPHEEDGPEPGQHAGKMSFLEEPPGGDDRADRPPPPQRSGEEREEGDDEAERQDRRVDAAIGALDEEDEDAAVDAGEVRERKAEKEPTPRKGVVEGDDQHADRAEQGKQQRGLEALERERDEAEQARGEDDRAERRAT